MSSTSKRGRPTAVYKTSWGDQIPGLMRLSDGRWRASGQDKFTFTEPDERLAIVRFRQWQAKRQGGNLGALRIHGNVEDALRDMARRMLEMGGFVDISMAAWPDSEEDPPRAWAVSDETLNTKQWAWLRRQILVRPRWVAEMVGIEQIGWLPDLKKPLPSPTLSEVGNLYLGHAKISNNWRAKCRLFWKEFADEVEVAKLRELTQEHVVAYADMIHEAAQAPTYARQRFGAVKAIINYPTKRGKWAEDAKRAIALCGVLVPPKKSATDPNPISPDAFRALHRAADPQMRRCYWWP